ncbi:MAG: hypothetical protein OHK0052_24240 [Anaerolineales bacterium]
MKSVLRLFVFVSLLLTALGPAANLTPVFAQDDAPQACQPLTETEQKELDGLAQQKADGKLGEQAYARLLELSERQDCAANSNQLEAIGIQAVSGYTFASSSGTYTEITGGSTLGSATNDDQLFPNLDIGFTFNYNGSDYTKIAVCSNGYVIMGLTSGSSCASPYTPISSSTYNQLISALGRDLQGNSGTGELRYETQGSSPNRTFTVQWKSYRKYSATGDDFNFQIVLYETTNVVEMKYGTFTVNTTSSTPQVGIKGDSTSDYSNRTTTTDWAASTAGSSNAATMTLSSTVKPTSGLTYTFTPPSGAPGCATLVSPADAGTNIPASATLNWSAGSGGVPTSYDVYFDTSTPPGFVVNQASSPYDPPGTMAYSTTYYWQIIPKNAYGDATGCPIWSFTTEADPTITTFPYSQNFDGGVAAGWTYENTNGDSKYWYFSSSLRRGTTGYGAAVDYNTTLAMDDWLFTPPLQLTGGTTYAVRFFYKARSASYPESLAVDWGSAANSASMSGSPIFDDADFAHITMKEAIATFTPPTNGVYYLGFHGYSDADMWSLVLDDVTIYDSSDSIWDWSGTTDTNWYVGSNWEGGIVPGELDTVNIPAAPSNQPAMATHGEVSYGRVNNLTIESGASLALETSHNLKVEGTLTNNGTLQQTHYLSGGGSANFLRIVDVAGTTTKYYGVDITNTNGIAMGTTVVKVKGNQTAGCTTNPLDALLYRCYEITPASNQQATIRYWFTEGERNGQDASALKLWHYDGPPGQWTAVGDTYTYSESGPTCTTDGGLACWFQAQNISTYSPFGLGSNAAPTAITLQNFGARSNTTFFALLLIFGMVISGVVLFYRKRG